MGHRSWGAATNSLYASLVGAILSLALSTSPAAARGTVAGTVINNTATVSYTFNGTPGTVTVPDPMPPTVQEVLDVTVTPLTTDKVSVSGGDTKRVLAFRVTNTGNGPEPFKLTARTAIPGDNFDPVRCDIALDANGNNTYELLNDTAYAPGQNDPELAPDASRVVFLLCNMPPELTEGDYAWAALDALAATATGDRTPGVVYENGGGTGIAAIVGLTTAFAGAQGGYQAVLQPPSFAKSQSVRDPLGGTTPRKDAIITYTLVAALTGGGITDARISDAIPAGTTYVPGSIELSTDGTNFSGLTDTADGDAGRFIAGQGIEVVLGDAPTSATRTIRFKVRINE